MRICGLGLCIVAIVWLNACGGASKEESLNIPKEQIADIQKLSQNSLIYLPNQHKIPSTAETKKLKEHYLTQFFQPWHSKPNTNTKEVFWIRDTLQAKGGLSENLQEYSVEEKREILKNMRLESYPSLKQKAIITTSTAVRALPSLKPLFITSNPYPFDRWQNSLIFSGTPVLITHLSEDKKFAHIQSSFVYGWVEVQHIAKISNEQAKDIEGSQFYLPTMDNITMLERTSGEYAFDARIGQILYSDRNAFMHFNRSPNGMAKIIFTTPKNKADKVHFAPLAQNLEPQKIAPLINAMIGQKYGWGGYLHNRDCSAFVRDIFALFGLHLPRNSKAQAFYMNNAIDLSALSPEAKEKMIIDKATPFMSVLWFQGHIMLYLGAYQGRAIVAHSVWSVKTGEKYENLLGGVVITSLYVGEERNSWGAKSPLLIDKVQAFSDFSVLAKNIAQKKRTK